MPAEPVRIDVKWSEEGWYASSLAFAEKVFRGRTHFEAIGKAICRIRIKGEHIPPIILVVTNRAGDRAYPTPCPDTPGWVIEFRKEVGPKKQ